MKKRLSENEITEIKSMWLQGSTTRHLGNLFGVSKNTISYHLKEEQSLYRVMRHDSPKVWGGKRSKFSDEQIEAMKKMRIDGYSSYHISITLKIPKDTVLRYTRGCVKHLIVNKIFFEPYFKVNKKQKACLTMPELKQLWEMYSADCNVHTICLYLSISSEYALECIEAAKWLYEGGLKQLKDHNTIFKSPVRPIEKFFRDDKREFYQRPPAEYTNQRLYDFNKN